MKRMTLPALALALAAWPAGVMADPGDGWRDGHMMWGWGHMMFGGLMMLLFWGAVIALIVLAVRWLSDNRAFGGRRDALEILRERFAAGEIDEEEYQRRKRVLEG